MSEPTKPTSPTDAAVEVLERMKSLRSLAVSKANEYDKLLSMAREEIAETETAIRVIGRCQMDKPSGANPGKAQEAREEVKAKNAAAEELALAIEWAGSLDDPKLCESLLISECDADGDSCVISSTRSSAWTCMHHLLCRSRLLAAYRARHSSPAATAVEPLSPKTLYRVVGGPHHDKRVVLDEGSDYGAPGLCNMLVCSPDPAHHKMKVAVPRTSLVVVIEDMEAELKQTERKSPMLVPNEADDTVVVPPASRGHRNPHELTDDARAHLFTMARAGATMGELATFPFRRLDGTNRVLAANSIRFALAKEGIALAPSKPKPKPEPKPKPADGKPKATGYKAAMTPEAKAEALRLFDSGEHIVDIARCQPYKRIGGYAAPLDPAGLRQLIKGTGRQIVDGRCVPATNTATPAAPAKPEPEAMPAVTPKVTPATAATTADVIQVRPAPLTLEKPKPADVPGKMPVLLASLADVAYDALMVAYCKAKGVTDVQLVDTDPAVNMERKIFMLACADIGLQSAYVAKRLGRVTSTIEIQTETARKLLSSLPLERHELDQVIAAAKAKAGIGQAASA